MARMTQKEIAEYDFAREAAIASGEAEVVTGVAAIDGSKIGKNLTDKEFDAVIQCFERGSDGNKTMTVFTLVHRFGLPEDVFMLAEHLPTPPLNWLLMVDAIHRDEQRKVASKGLEFDPPLTHMDIFSQLVEGKFEESFGGYSIQEVRNRKYPKPAHLLSVGMVH